MRAAKTVTFLNAVLVFLMGSCSMHHPGESDLFNVEGALPGGMPVPVLEFKVIASYVDRQHSTMSTLTGNDLAVQTARAASGSIYPAGAILALATWPERDDPHWFGGRIPGHPLSMETVTVTIGSDGRPMATYARYAGEPMKQISDVAVAIADARKGYILAQRASVMP
jgi:hypothetical protein